MTKYLDQSELDDEPPAKRVMTPRQHYEAATRLLTNGLPDVERVRQGTSDPALARWMLDHLTAYAHVHAVLATVPQAQYDEWKTVPKPTGKPATASSVSCHNCGRVLFELDERGSVVQPAPVGQFEFSGGIATCSEDDPTGCRQLMEPRLKSDAERRLAAARAALVRTGYFTAEQVGDDVAPRIIELWSALRDHRDAPPRDGATQSGYAKRRQLGDENPCRHGASVVRCRFCNQDADPTLVCGACGVPAWAPHRMVGSRCDLTGCAGVMVPWPGPKP